MKQIDKEIVNLNSHGIFAMSCFVLAEVFLELSIYMFFTILARIFADFVMHLVAAADVRTCHHAARQCLQCPAPST